MLFHRMDWIEGPYYEIRWYANVISTWFSIFTYEVNGLLL